MTMTQLEVEQQLSKFCEELLAKGATRSQLSAALQIQRIRTREELARSKAGLTRPVE
jgi:hypothetical protein